jgi:hypothetical protein
MSLQSPLLHELLCRDVASSKENGRCYGLCEQRASSQSAIVPEIAVS